MRVPTISIYNQAAYQLNRLTCNLNEANEVVTTECRINDCSDDPAGMAHVLDINSAISCMDQCQVNTRQGLTVLQASETALDAMADQILELNLLCAQLANASASASERTDAAQSMQVYLDQIMDLANTRAYGGYVFAGDNNQVPPFQYDDPGGPTCVTYGGGTDPTCVKTGRDTAISVGHCGSDLFYEDQILVDATNNLIEFREDPGTGAQNILTIEARVPSGSYTREALALAVEQTINQASLEQGFGIGYEVTYNETDNAFSLGTDSRYEGTLDTTFQTVQRETVRISGLTATSGAYPEMEIEITTPASLTRFTPEPEGTAPLTLTWSEDGTWSVSNDPGYGLPATIEGDAGTLELDMDQNGVTDILLSLNAEPQAGTTVCFDIVPGLENNSILPDLGFDTQTIALTPARSSAEVAGPKTVVTGKNDTIDFTETLTNSDQASTQLTAVIPAGTYATPQAYAGAVARAMETASAAAGNRVNYEVLYDDSTQAFTIREDTDTGRRLDAFDLLFGSGTHAQAGAAEDLGFQALDVHSGPVQGEPADWGIFDTLFDLETALADNDVDSIQRAMIRLENHYASLTSSMASVGRAYAGLTNTQSLASTTRLTLISQRSDVRDADTIESVMVLNTVQTTYEAALNACSKMMNLSLVDYL